MLIAIASLALWNYLKNSFRLTYNHCVKSAQIRSFSGPYFPLFRLNMEIYIFVFSPNTGKYGPEKSPYLDTL